MFSDEELLLEETLSCSSLAECDCTVQKIDEDEDHYDEENALSEEERQEHKPYVDLANECAQESPDPQTKVGRNNWEQNTLLKTEQNTCITFGSVI